MTVEGMSPGEAAAFLKREAIWQDERKQPQLERLAQLAGDRFDLLDMLSSSVAACDSSAAASLGAHLPTPIERSNQSYRDL